MAYQYPFAEAAELLKRTVWNKGTVIASSDRSVWRRDICGNIINYEEHGNTVSQHGWEIDHIRPAARGGKDEINNLQPLQWENNRKKRDIYPWRC